MTLNLLAAALLLWADLAAVVPPTKLQSPAFLAIGFEVLAIANLVFAFSWLFSCHKSWCIVSILAILFSSSQLRASFSLNFSPARGWRSASAWHFEKERLTESQANRDRDRFAVEERELSVLTYNTHLLQNNTPVEQNELLRYIHTSGADIVCMQEYAVYKDAHYPTFDQVKNALADTYPYTYFDFSVHNGRLQFGLAVYSKFPLINKTTIPINTTGNGANYCDVIARGDTFRLFNNHLQSNSIQSSEIDSLLSRNAKEYTMHSHSQLTGKLSQAYAARTAQVEAVRAAIDASPYPVIVCGDFNDVPASYAYRHVSQGLKDAFLTTSFLRTGHTYVRRRTIPKFRSSSLTPGIRIDYILTSPKLRATDCRVDRVPYSDHYPVIATLTW